MASIFVISIDNTWSISIVTVNKIVIKSIIREVQQNLLLIRNMSFTLDSLKNDKDVQHLVERRLHLALEGCIDLAAHVVVAENWNGCDKAAESFIKLGENEVIPKALASRLSKAVGFRNILVHDYTELDYEIVYEVSKKGINDLDKFVGLIVKRYLASE